MRERLRIDSSDSHCNSVACQLCEFDLLLTILCLGPQMKGELYRVSWKCAMSINEQTNACVHPRTQARTHAHLCTHTHNAHTHAHMCARVHTCAQCNTHAHMCTRHTHAHTLTHMCAHARTHSRVQHNHATCTHTCTYAHIHAHVRARVHRHVHTHAHKHILSHTRTRRRRPLLTARICMYRRFSLLFPLP